LVWQVAASVAVCAVLWCESVERLSVAGSDVDVGQFASIAAAAAAADGRCGGRDRFPVTVGGFGCVARVGAAIG